jgi:hypothetical protein
MRDPLGASSRSRRCHDIFLAQNRHSDTATVLRRLFSPLLKDETTASNQVAIPEPLTHPSPEASQGCAWKRAGSLANDNHLLQASKPYLAQGACIGAQARIQHNPTYHRPPPSAIGSRSQCWFPQVSGTTNLVAYCTFTALGSRSLG